MIIFGIDPGVSGAISVLENKKIIEVFDMPTMIDGKKNKRQVNGSQVTNIIKEKLNNDKEIVVVVEHVNAMPGQGVTSMFNFGQSFGVIKGICSALSLPIYFVRPTKWKKYFNSLSDASKISLKLLGGVLNKNESKEFEKKDFFKQSIKLRKFDEVAKKTDIKMKSIIEYKDLLSSQLI